VPHLQVRSSTRRSPADADGVLDVLRRAGINILAVTGSNIEAEGEIGVMLRHEDVEPAHRELNRAGYRARIVGPQDGLHEGTVEDRVGGLLDALREARRAHPRGLILDLAVGLESEERTRPDGTTVRGYPLQVFFIEPPERDDDGNIVK